MSSYRFWGILSFALLLAYKANAQFYISKQVCSSPVSTLPPPPPTSGINTGICAEPTRLFDTDPLSVKSEWILPSGIIIPSRNANATFDVPGQQSISLRKTYADGTVTTVSKSVTVGRFPTQPTFNKKENTDTTVCKNKTVKLDPFDGIGAAPSGVSYLWYPGGQTSPTLDVDTSGCYSVKVIDNASGCFRSAKISVKFCFEPPPDVDSFKEKWLLGSGGILEFTTNFKEVKRDSTEEKGELNDTKQLEKDYKAAVIAGNPLFNSIGAAAVVYDRNQKLRFYSDGNRIFEGENNTVIKNQNGSDHLVGGITAAQGLWIVPRPACNECDYTQFYLFKVDPTSKTLLYSVIDVRYNNKKGVVIEENIPLLYPVSEKLNASLNFDEKGFTVTGSNPATGQFYTINIDSTGVNVIGQTIGSVSNNPASNDGATAVSPNGRILATGIIIGGQNFIQLFDKDPVTNALSNPRLIDLGIASPPSVYGVTFSPGGDFIYVTLSGDVSKGERSYFIQLWLQDGTPAQIGANKVIISSSITDSYGSVLTGPIFQGGNKYVYLSIKGQNILPYIQNPDVKGAVAVNFSLNNTTEKGVDLGAATANLGLPNLVKSPDPSEGDGLSANYQGNCQNAPTIFSTQGICSPFKNEATWTFPDGSTKDGLQVSYTFTTTGWKNVKLTVKVYYDSKIGAASNSQVINNATKVLCHTETYEGTIFIKPQPVITLDDNVFICVSAGQSKLLDPKPTGGTGFTFDWKTSLNTTLANTPTYTADVIAPVYKLEVKNNLNCSVEKKFAVLDKCEPVTFIPNVFTPNGDGKNDTFKPIVLNYKNYDLKIYNRWGELVFKSTKIDELWDGSFRGKTVSGQLYPYVLKFLPEFFPDRGFQTVKGAVLVLK